MFLRYVQKEKYINISIDTYVINRHNGITSPYELGLVIIENNVIIISMINTLTRTTIRLTMFGSIMIFRSGYPEYSIVYHETGDFTRVGYKSRPVKLTGPDHDYLRNSLPIKLYVS